MNRSTKVCLGCGPSRVVHSELLKQPDLGHTETRHLWWVIEVGGCAVKPGFTDLNHGETRVKPVRVVSPRVRHVRRGGRRSSTLMATTSAQGRFLACSEGTKTYVCVRPTRLEVSVTPLDQQTRPSEQYTSGGARISACRARAPARAVRVQRDPNAHALRRDVDNDGDTTMTLSPITRRAPTNPAVVHIARVRILGEIDRRLRTRRRLRLRP